MRTTRSQRGRARSALLACFWLCAPLAASAQTPAAAQAPAPAQTPAHAPLTDPDAIFRAARKAWSFINYPRYATFTIVTRFRNGKVNVVRHYDALQDMRRDIVFAHTFSREEIADPSIPHGFNLKLGSLNGVGGAGVDAPTNPDIVGPLALSVGYSFGISLLPENTNVVSSTKDIQFPPNLPIIGVTTTTTHDYTVKLLGMLDGGKTYHLGLEPTRKAASLRLRQMWISADTLVTKRILISGNFNREPYTTVPWLVEFTRIGGADYITKETAEAPLDFTDGPSIPNLTIAFEDLTLLSALPKYGTVGANDSGDVLRE